MKIVIVIAIVMLASALAFYAFLKSKQVQGLSKAIESGTKQMPWPVKDKSGKVIGVAVPVINKVFYFADVPEDDERMEWKEAMDYAAKRGRSLPTQKELMICFYFKDAINAIAEEAGHPDFLYGWIWSSTEYNQNNAWNVYFNNGNVNNNSKYGTNIVVRPVAAL